MLVLSVALPRPVVSLALALSVALWTGSVSGAGVLLGASSTDGLSVLSLEQLPKALLCCTVLEVTFQKTTFCDRMPLNCARSHA